MNQKKADIAEPLLKQAVALSPSSALAFYYLGSAEMTLNKYASAQEAMQTAPAGRGHPGACAQTAPGSAGYPRALLLLPEAVRQGEGRLQGCHGQ